jgi:hypothetical protein
LDRLQLSPDVLPSDWVVLEALELDQHHREGLGYAVVQLARHSALDFVYERGRAQACLEGRENHDRRGSHDKPFLLLTDELTNVRREDCVLPIRS